MNNFIGVFLYGSQNYCLDNENSDTDSIVLVCSADKPKETKYTPKGQMKIYTLKYFIYRLKKGDLECYEILFTKYRFINPLYENIFNTFANDFSQCMNYERLKLSLCIKLDEHLHHVFWILTKNVEKAKYDKKRLYWAMRVCNQLQRLSHGENFESSLIYKGEDLLKIKSITNYLSPKEAKEKYDYLANILQAQGPFQPQVSEKEEECFSYLVAQILKEE